MQEARLERDSPPTDRELESGERAASCPARAGLLLLPGLMQLCRGRKSEGIVLTSLAVAELGGAVAGGVANGLDTSAVGVPSIALGDLLTLSVMDVALENQRAARLRYVPQESLGELALAPFSGEVLSRPSVWAGIAASLAAGILVSAIVDRGIDTHNAGKRPVIFGREIDTAPGYLMAGAIGAGLFEHVAIAEEMAFRGVLQSSWARSLDETRGWAYASLLFGAVHGANILFIDRSQRLAYLAAGVPFITLLGGYLGLAYRWNRYSLAPSVAIHFWYDFLIEAAGFLADPKNSPLAVSWGMAF
jgi:membrane protease YdiL (CAAX protease family)